MKVYSVQDGDDVLLVAPVRKFGRRKVKLFGDFNYVDVLLAEDKPAETLRAAFLKFLCCLADDGFDVLEWNCLDSASLSRRFLGEIFSGQKFTVERNVKIPLDIHETFSAYTASLSKSVRQNIRTAYNRLSRGGHVIKAGTFFRDELRNDSARKILAACDDIYVARQVSRYGFTSLRTRIGKRFFRYSAQIPEAEEGFCAFITVDDEVAAFMYGYDNRRIMSVEVPKLAINDKFKFYSPGLLLVNETVKILMEKGYRYLDLTHGDEKYKFDMGGIEYPTESAVIDLTPLRG
ncbi:MAG: GNAT family N-acetyltransferase [Synergistaceae bacterium]|nr:GNAT family N-acetyltransferase [Synergistaceae bacterium]MBQ7168859.1 GNAT family N-acetyltransferase [Synergistaceae bacterium]